MGFLIFELIWRLELIKKGDKVGSSEVVLLANPGIQSFSYGLIVQSVYDNDWYLIMKFLISQMMI